jgi:hypothetical protein
MAKEKEVKTSEDSINDSTTTFTKEEISILYQLSQSATISVKDMQVVAELLNKCLNYINQK